jgi:hypothetical protein
MRSCSAPRKNERQLQVLARAQLVESSLEILAFHCSTLCLEALLMKADGMRRPVSGRDAEYAPKLSTCSRHR